MEVEAGHGLRGYRAVWNILRKDYGLSVKGDNLDFSFVHASSPLKDTDTRSCIAKENCDGFDEGD